jgi:hypothetical protein
MARGQTVDVGATRVSANGYHYTKTKDGWRLTHHIIAEEKYRMPITSEHLVRFVDGKRTNLKPSNIEVVTRGRGTLRRRKAILEARIEELQAELKLIEQELAK